MQTCKERVGSQNARSRHVTDIFVDVMYGSYDAEIQIGLRRSYVVRGRSSGLRGRSSWEASKSSLLYFVWIYESMLLDSSTCCQASSSFSLPTPISHSSLSLLIPHATVMCFVNFVAEARVRCLEIPESILCFRLIPMI